MAATQRRRGGRRYVFAIAGALKLTPSIAPFALRTRDVAAVGGCARNMLTRAAALHEAARALGPDSTNVTVLGTTSLMWKKDSGFTALQKPSPYVYVYGFDRNFDEIWRKALSAPPTRRWSAATNFALDCIAFGPCL